MKYQKDEILKALKIKVDELGRFPKKREINEDPRLPSSETYRKYFGNLPQLAIAIGLPACQGKKRRGYDHDELLIKLKERAKKLDRMPTIREINKFPDLPCANTIYRYFGSLPALGKQLGFASKVRYSRFYTDEELLRLLKLRADKLGKVPSTLNIEKDTEMPPFGAYKRRFGSYANAVRLIGYEPRERYRKKEIPFDEFKGALLNFYIEHKRVPSANEFMKVCKHYRVYVDGKRANWNQLVNLCGLPIHTRTWSMRLHRKAELFVKSLLTRLSYTITDATIGSVRAPYDLLINGNIRIQVSASTVRKKRRLEWHFNFPRQKKLQYVIGVGYNDCFEEEAIFVFPVDEITTSGAVVVALEKESKYSKFRIKTPEGIGEYIM